MLQLVSDRISMLNPAKDDTWYDAAKVKEFMACTPPGGRPARPDGRYRGQHSRRARHWREGRGRICWPSSHPSRSAGAAAEVERKMHRESLQNNVERIQMSKRLAVIATDVPSNSPSKRVEGAGARPALLKAIYRRWSSTVSSGARPARTRGSATTA